MPKYDDDQCEECGAARASGSRLCVGCLVRAYDRERRKKQVLQKLIDSRDLGIAKLKELLEDAIWYGFKQNRKITHLEKQIEETVDIIKRGLEDGKERETANTEK